MKWLTGVLYNKRPNRIKIHEYHPSLLYEQRITLTLSKSQEGDAEVRVKVRKHFRRTIKAKDGMKE